MEHELSTLDTICSQPLFADPYEDRHVEVRHCKLVLCTVCTVMFR